MGICTGRLHLCRHCIVCPLVYVLIEYHPLAGAAGAIVAKLLGEEPNTQVREDLQHFKQIMETGEMPSTESPLKDAV